MLGIVHEGVAFPVMWTMLDKRGNSNSDERIALVGTLRVGLPQSPDSLSNRRPRVYWKRMVQFLDAAKSHAVPSAIASE